MTRLFGTDGVRGVANREPMTAETVLQIGRAIAHVCLRHEHRHRRHRVVIGKDTRVSGYMLENALTAGICSMGVDVFLVGPMPTPGVAFITRSMRADAGLMLSASHNPYMDNGIKIFSREGFKLPDAEEDEIERLVLSGEIRDIRPTAGEVGRAKRIDDAMGRYIVFCQDTFPTDMSLDGLTIALDCANGAAYRVAPIIFSEMGAKVRAIHARPNGLNINDGCGSQHTGDLRACVVENRADIGLAFDGDGDRLIAVDEQGNEIGGDQILGVCAKMYLDAGQLRNRKIVATVMSNIGLTRAMRPLGIEINLTSVGDRYVLERMKEIDAVLGGEASGHVIFRDRHTTGDGIVTALQLLCALRRNGGPVSALTSLVRLSPQKLINIDVKHKPPLADLTALQAALREAEASLADAGRVLVRYSGTQAQCRVMVEGPTEEVAGHWAQRLADIVHEAAG